MSGRRRSWWGWGWEDAAVTGAELEDLAGRVRAMRPEVPDLLPTPPVPDLPPPAVSPPSALADMCDASDRARSSHAMGKAYRDVARALRGQIPRPPDLVVHPESEGDVVAVLDWAAGEQVAVVPYGGGSSVVGAVECDPGDAFRGVVSLDLARLDQVPEVDRESRAVRAQAGIFGPALEEALAPHDLTLRHFPQSFEFSTLGGWIATRSAGHYATGPTHIDDHVESLRVVAPTGLIATRRLPASGAGPDPNRLFLGSEGALGVITEAWVRVRPRPAHRASATVSFAGAAAAVAATRAVAQSGLQPATCRLLDAAEGALFAGVTDGTHTLLIGFESAAAPVEGALAQAVEIAADLGGEMAGSGSGTAAAWREGFLRAPYLRDGLARLGLVVETFETACTWDRFEALHLAVVTASLGAVTRLCGGGVVTMRFTHVYPDGPAPYFTVLAPGRPGDEVAMWDEVKAAVSEAILDGGGTITHHHAVGRVHDPWYRRERPDAYGAALAAIKETVDPAGILNPGVLV